MVCVCVCSRVSMLRHMCGVCVCVVGEHVEE